MMAEALREFILEALISLDIRNCTEKDIENSILRELEVDGFQNFKDDYTQSFPRIKNHTNAKPDIVVEKNSQIILIETKLLPDSKRVSSRFERSFIDCAFLKNEKIENGIKGYFLILDREDTGYFKDKKFLEITEKLLDIQFDICINWEKIRAKGTATVFMSEIKTHNTRYSP